MNRAQPVPCQFCLARNWLGWRRCTLILASLTLDNGDTVNDGVGVAFTPFGTTGGHSCFAPGEQGGTVLLCVADLELLFSKTVASMWQYRR
jgi:hypothetical protein